MSYFLTVYGVSLSDAHFYYIRNPQGLSLDYFTKNVQNNFGKKIVLVPSGFYSLLFHQIWFGKNSLTTAFSSPDDKDQALARTHALYVITQVLGLLQSVYYKKKK